jgi:hypothetical protein
MIYVFKIFTTKVLKKRHSANFLFLCHFFSQQNEHSILILNLSLTMQYYMLHRNSV